MPESKKNEAANNVAAKETKYVPLRDLPKEEIMKLPSVKTFLEKYQDYSGNEKAKITLEFHDKWRKEITSAKIIDIRRYNSIVLSIDSFDDSKNIHLSKQPCRFLHRHDENGEIVYRRVEFAYTKEIVISVFLDNTDEIIMNKIDYKIDWVEDKDSTNQFTMAKADVDYSYFG